MTKEKTYKKNYKKLSYPSLSLCMIVRDEAKNLGFCIEPILPLLNEVIIVDTGSKDLTKDVAKKLGAKVIDFPWIDDFSAARNESIRHATCDYIIWLDADDRIDSQNIEKLKKLKIRFPQRKDQAYYFIIDSEGVDGNTQFLQLRIFPNIKGVKFEGKIHEQVYFSLSQLGIKFIKTDIILNHIGYSDKDTAFKKAERNLKIILDELELDPKNLNLHYHAGRTLAGINRQLEAIDHMKMVFEDKTIKGKDKQFYLTAGILLGKYYGEINLYENAISIFEDLKKDFKGISLIHILLGITYYSAGYYERAKKELEKSLSMDLDVALFPLNIKQIKFYQYYVLGNCYLKEGDESLAKEMFLKSLNLHKDYYKSLQILALLSLKAQRYEEAIEFYKKLIETGKDIDQSYANLGLALKKIGAWKDAEDAFKKSIEINPERLEAIVNLGYLYYERKEYDKATFFFHRALALNKELIDARIALSEIYFREYDIDNLVEQCNALLGILNLPRNIIIESFDDLGSLYESVGKVLYEMGSYKISVMAYYVSFLINPSKDIFERIIKISSLLKEGEKWFHLIEEAVIFNARNGKILDLSKSF